MKNCTSLGLLILLLSSSCNPKGNKEDTDCNGKNKYLQLNWKFSLLGISEEIVDLELQKESDTIFLSKLVEGEKYIVLFLQNSGCNKCNIKLFKMLKESMQKNRELNCIVIGHDINQRISKLKFDNMLYTLPYNNNLKLPPSTPLMFILEPSLKTNCFFIPDKNYIDMFRDYIEIAKSKL